jgi:hypothetical protein
VGDREDHYFSIHNDGDEDLVLSGPLYVNISGADHHDFEVRYFPSQTIPPGEWTSFAIRFEPESGGEKYATVSIYSNDSSNSPYMFSIRGGEEDDDSFRWIAVGSCGTSRTMGMGDALWVPLILLVAAILRRRGTTCASDRR